MSLRQFVWWESPGNGRRYLKKNTIYPGESVSGFVYVAWIKGERAVFIIRIEGAEYIYEWGFDKKNAFLLNKNN